MAWHWWLAAMSLFYALALARCLLRRRSRSRPQPATSASGAAAAAAATTPSSASTLATPPLSPAAHTTPGLPVRFPIRYVVAPMVDQCDLAYRMQCRAGGADLVYTAMFFSDRFAIDPVYRRQAFATCEGDRPLAVQFCANDPQVLLAAARHVENSCDAIDLNLGCPQRRAEEGHFGSYLLDRPDWPLVESMVHTLHRSIRIPVFCKIRLLPKLKDTIEFCLMLEAAGCSLIAVHGRPRAGHDKRRVGPARLDDIRRIKQALRIPVVSNGNVRSYADVLANLKFTGCDGVMSGEAILANPLLFNGQPTEPFALCEQYLSFCDRYDPPPIKWVADHCKNMVRPLLRRHGDVLLSLRGMGLHAADSPARVEPATPHHLAALRALLADLQARVARDRLLEQDESAAGTAAGEVEGDDEEKEHAGAERKQAPRDGNSAAARRRQPADAGGSVEVATSGSVSTSARVRSAAIAMRRKARTRATPSPCSVM